MKLIPITLKNVETVVIAWVIPNHPANLTDTSFKKTNPPIMLPIFFEADCT